MDIMDCDCLKKDCIGITMSLQKDNIIVKNINRYLRHYKDDINNPEIILLKQAQKEILRLLEGDFTKNEEENLNQKQKYVGKSK